MSKQATKEQRILQEVIEGENYFLNLMEGAPFDELAAVSEQITKEFYFWNLILENPK